MTSADVIRAHAVGILVEADVRQPRQRETIAPVAEANFASMRDQMIRANRSIAVDLDYQTQRAASAEARVALLRRHVRQWKIFVGFLIAMIVGLSVMWGMAR